MMRRPIAAVAAVLCGLLGWFVALPAAAAEPVTLRGVVTDGSGQGWPLWSTVTVTGGGTTHSSPFNGRYALAVQPDTTYTVTVQPDAAGYPALTREVHVGTGDTVADFAVPVDADSCQAPGYRHTSDGVVASFDAGPGDWSVTDALGNGQVWRFDDPGRHGNLTGGLDGFAILDSEYYGFDQAQDSALVSPVADLTGVAEPTIGFRSDLYLFDYSEPSGIADVDLSLDGGTTWENVWRADVVRRGPDQVTVPIPQAAGKSSVRMRFRYHETAVTAGVWWQVDSAWLGNRSCDPAPGGLVTGYTRDRNTGAGLADAVVRGPGGAQVRSVATADDPALEDGFYSLFSPATGARELTASAPEYQSQVRRIEVADGNQPTRANFSLAAGRIVASTTGLSSGQVLGEVVDSTLQLRNEGTANATVTLAERPGAFSLLMPGGERVSAATLAADEGAPLRRVDGEYSPLASGGRVTASRQAAAVQTGDAWTVAADYPIAISDNAATAYQGKVYSVGGQEDHEYGVRDAYVYDPVAAAWSALPPLPRGRQAPSVGFLGGKLHVVGGWSESNWGYDALTVPEVDVYDPATGQWTSGPKLPSPVAAAGSAVLDDKLYVVGGCPEAEVCGVKTVQRYDAATRTWERLADYPEAVAWLTCGAIEETVYCAGGTLEGGPPVRSSDATYAYNPRTDTWTRKADVPIELWGSSGTVAGGRFNLAGGVTNGARTVTNQAFGYDPLTDSWSALPNTTYTLYRGSGACGFYRVGGAPPTGLSSPFVELLPGWSDCGSDRDAAWVSATPAGKVVLRPGQRIDVGVRFDASVVSQPGSYAAQLLVREDTPYPTGTVDLTMTVDPPRRWGLLRGTVSGTSCDGTVRPLPGATVWLDGRLDDFTLPTDSTGAYAQWLDARNAPATLVAGLDGWIPEVRTVDLRAGRPTVVDVTLQENGC